MYTFETVHQLLDKINEEKASGNTRIEVEFSNMLHMGVVASSLEAQGHGFTLSAVYSTNTLIIDF